MKILKITINGNPVTKKNSQEIRFRNWRKRTGPFIIPSAIYRAYERDFCEQCINSHVVPNEPLNEPIEVTCLYYRKTRIRCDLTNLLECTDDCLVKANIIKDDNFKIIVSHDGSRVLFDKENPRVEIIIKTLN